MKKNDVKTVYSEDIFILVLFRDIQKACLPRWREGPQTRTKNELIIFEIGDRKRVRIFVYAVF